MFKRSFVRRFISVLSCVMTISAIGTGTMAATDWELHYYPGASTSANTTTCVAGYYFNSSSKAVNESCNSFTSTPATNGSVSYAYYTGYYIDRNGNIVENLLTGGTYYHYSALAKCSITLTKIVPKYSTLYFKYKLSVANTSATTRISGKLGD